MSTSGSKWYYISSVRPFISLQPSNKGLNDSGRQRLFLLLLLFLFFSIQLSRNTSGYSFGLDIGIYLVRIDSMVTSLQRNAIVHEDGVSSKMEQQNTFTTFFPTALIRTIPYAFVLL